MILSKRNFKKRTLLKFTHTSYRAASGGPISPLRFEEAFKGERGILGGKFAVLTNDAF